MRRTGICEERGSGIDKAGFPLTLQAAGKAVFYYLNNKLNICIL